MVRNRRTIRKGQSAGPACAPGRTRRNRRRLKWAVGFGVILLAALAAALAVLYLGQRNPPLDRARESRRGAAARMLADSTLPPEQQIELLKTREMELAEQVLRDLPVNGGAWILMGDLQRRLGRSAKAAEFWQKGLALAPRRVDAYHSLGTVAAEKGEFDQALAFWRQGLALKAQTPGLHRVIGRALVDLGRYEEAIRELQEELRLTPQSAESYCLLGDALLQQQDYEQAGTCYEKAVELAPKSPNAWYGLSTTCAKLGQADRATECRTIFTRLRADLMAERKYSHSPADDLARTRQSMAGLSMDAAGLYGAAGKMAKAEELLQQAAAVDPGNAAPVRKLAAFYNSTGRLPEALTQCEKVGRLDPNDAPCHLLIGTLALQLRRADRAETAFRRFIALAPQEAAGYRELARLYLNTGTRLAEARQLAGKAAELERAAENYFVLGQACQRAKDRPAALAALQRAVQLAPGNLEYKQTYDLVRKGR